MFIKFLSILLLIISPISSGGLSIPMTSRFPLACQGKYTAPYTYTMTTRAPDKVCVILHSSSLCSSAKCKQAQENVRKLAISTKQTVECAAKQIAKSGPKSGTSPFQASLQTPTGTPIGGVSIVWFWYTYLKNTQVSIEVARAMQFRRLNDTNIDGYQLCLKGKNISNCVLNNANLTNIATFNVTDHTCDSGVLSKI